MNTIKELSLSEKLVSISLAFWKARTVWVKVSAFLGNLFSLH